MSLLKDKRKTANICIFLVCICLGIFMIAFGIGVADIENKIYGYIMTATGIMIAILFIITTVIYITFSKESRKQKYINEEISILKDCLCEFIDIHSSIKYNTKETGIITAEGYYNQKQHPDTGELDECLRILNEKEIEDIKQTLMDNYAEDREFLGNLLYELIEEKALYDYIVKNK